MNTDLTKKCRICLLAVGNLATMNIFDHKFKDVLDRFERLIGTSVIRGSQLPNEICVRCVSHITQVFRDLEKWTQIQHNLNAQQIIHIVQKHNEKKENSDTTLEAPSQYTSASRVSTLDNNTNNEQNNHLAEPSTLQDITNNEIQSLLSQLYPTSKTFLEILYNWSLDMANKHPHENLQTNLEALPINNEYFKQQNIAKLNPNAEQLTSTTNLNRIELYNAKNFDSPENFNLINAPPVAKFSKPYFIGNKQYPKSIFPPNFTITASSSSTPIVKPSLSNGTKENEFNMPYLFGYQKETTKYNTLPTCTITHQSNINPFLSSSPLSPLAFNTIENHQKPTTQKTSVPKDNPSLVLFGNDKDMRPHLNKHSDQKKARKIQMESIRKQHFEIKKNIKSFTNGSICKSKKPCLLRMTDFANICKQNFNHSAARSLHERYDEEYHISCNNCKKSFKTIQELRLHVSRFQILDCGLNTKQK